VKIAGKVQARGKAVVKATVTVYGRVATDGGTWRKVRVTRTARSGKFVVNAQIAVPTVFKVRVAGSKVRKPKTVTVGPVGVASVASLGVVSVSSPGTSDKRAVTLTARLTPDGPMPPLSQRTFSGTLTDAVTGEGIPGAVVVSYTPDAAGYSKTGKPLTWFTVTTDQAGSWSWTGPVGALGPGGSLRVEQTSEYEGLDAPDFLMVAKACDAHGSPDGGCWQSAEDAAREVVAWRAAHGWGPMTYPLSAGCLGGQWAYRGSAAASGSAPVVPVANLMGSTGHFTPVAGGPKYETAGFEYGLEVTVYGGGPGEGWGVRLQRFVCL
jgi:hypothetical protein